MEIKTDALVLRAADYNENDKILTLLTAEYGKISAGIKGVKKPAAKLRFAAQPFCFAEYVLSERGGRYTVINCTEYESFYDLRTDINKFYAASAATEAANILSYEGGGGEIFPVLVKTLTAMCSGDEKIALISFLVTALRAAGYGLSCGDCLTCGKDLCGADKLRFDMDAGAFTCYDCGSGAGVSRVTFNVLRKLDGKPYEEDFITTDGAARALKLIKAYFEYKTDNQLKSLSEYIRLI